MMKRHLLLIGMLCLVPLPAEAQFYVGGSATSTASNFKTAVDTFKSHELGWKAFAGYTFLDFLGAEVSYRDLGTLNEGSTDSSIDLDVKMLDGSVRAYLPVSIIDLFVKAGYARVSWDGRINVRDAIQNFNRDEWDLFYGVGAELKLGDKLALRAEWEKYNVSDSLNTLSGGLVYRF